MGQSPEDEDGTDTGAGTTDDTTPPGEGDAGDSNDTASKDPRVKELSDEAARRRIENKELKTQLDEAMSKLKEIEDKDKSEVERATAKLAELEEKLTANETALQQERIEKAFLASNKYAWHNSERALSLVDLSEVTIDEDGKVTGLDKALEKLAKSDPYLIKSEGSDGDKGTGPTGTPAGSGDKKDKGAADREKLVSKYPVLRR